MAIRTSGQSQAKETRSDEFYEARPCAIIARRATGEDRAAYDELLAAVNEAVQPTDVLEQIWTSEAVEKQWEALRQRRFKTAFIAACWQEALRTILHSLLSYGERFILDSDDMPGALAWKYTLGDEDAIKEVEELLSQAKLTKEAVHAQAMALHIETFATFDRLIWAAESLEPPAEQKQAA